MVWAVSSKSSASIAAGAMVRSTSSPWPLRRAVTRPPPAVPDTSVSASSCWALISCSCICWAAASSCCISSWPSGFTWPPLGVVSVNWRAYGLRRTLSTVRWGSSRADPAPDRSVGQSPIPAGSVLDLTDDLPAQLTLDQVHPGDLGLAGGSHVVGVRYVEVIGEGGPGRAAA